MRLDRWAWVMFLGALLGIATAVTDVLGGGLDPGVPARAAAVVLNAGSTWAGLAVLAGWVVGRPVPATVAGATALLAAIAGVIALVTAVVAYYGYGVLFGDRTEIGIAGVGGAVRLWSIAAVAAGPVLGVVGALIHRGGAVGLLASLVVPVGVAIEMLALRGLDGREFAIDPALAWGKAAAVAAAIGWAAAAVLVRAGGGPRRMA